ncbi:DUF4123 domain-containing protein [Rhizobium sp. CSW-27]|uniref:DUF4123 domain-containing protein n=1 Tax=Rhizobium sp. CSW-27 TaxID=2839985 RepID=UPI001C02A23C|nr:DUF4123 domain-containing protein [Rhizobium sp. CSW-27]MBT9373068.1 DUF4123 domain-containing protein [Rhizobium sp. CSW-27]
MMEQILSALDSLEGRKFAVIDGAHFDDLPSSLLGLNLPLNPLYQEEADPDLQALGPFLVPLRDRLVARQLHALADGRPALVWWSWPDEGEQSGDAVYRHVRSLNLVEVPTDTPEGVQHDGDDHLKRAPIAPGPHHHCDHTAHVHGEETVPAPRQLYEPAFLRHADPKVMAALLPLLNAQQVSRLFGQAGGIVLECPASGGIRCFARPGHLPPTPQGMLRILPPQYARLAPIGERSLCSRGHH